MQETDLLEKIFKQQPKQEEGLIKFDPYKEWQDMPECNNKKKDCYTSVIFKFSCEEDLKALAKLIGQNLTRNTRSVWYPKAVQGLNTKLLYINKNDRDEYENKKEDEFYKDEDEE